MWRRIHCADGPRDRRDGSPPCSIVGMDRNFRTPYVESWSLGIQRAITNSLSLDIEYVGNHGVKLVGFTDINQPQQVGGFSPGGETQTTRQRGRRVPCTVAKPVFDNCAPMRTPNRQPGLSLLPVQILRFLRPSGQARPGGSGGPFNPKNLCASYLADITMINNSTMSNYNGVQISINGRNYHGLSFNAGYTYSHALGMASDEGRASDLSVPLNNYASLRSQLYMPTNYDLRHRGTISLTYAVPGKKGYGQMLEGWTLNSVIVLQSGSPWGQSDLTTDWNGTGELNNAAGSVGGQWNFYGNPADFTPVHGWTDTNPQQGGGFGGGLPFFPGGTLTTGTIMAAVTPKPQSTVHWQWLRSLTLAATPLATPSWFLLLSEATGFPAATSGATRDSRIWIYRWTKRSSSTIGSAHSFARNSSTSSIIPSSAIRMGSQGARIQRRAIRTLQGSAPQVRRLMYAPPIPKSDPEARARFSWA